MKIRFSMKIKFVVMALLISMVSFGVAAYISNRWAMDDFEKDYHDKAMLMGNHLVHDLSEGMTYKPHDGIIQSLEFYRRYKEVEELRIFNQKGKRSLILLQRVLLKPDWMRHSRQGNMIHFHKVCK